MLITVASSVGKVMENSENADFNTLILADVSDYLKPKQSWALEHTWMGLI